MSEDTYIHPNHLVVRGVTSPGAPIPLAPPQVLGSNEDVGSGAWEKLSLTGANLATGVRVKNYGSVSSMIQVAGSASECPDKGFHLEEGEEVFIEIPRLGNVFVRGVGGSATLTFIAS